MYHVYILKTTCIHLILILLQQLLVDAHKDSEVLWHWDGD